MINICIRNVFTDIELKKHNKVLKEGNFPGITSTIKAKVTLAADNGGLDHVSGFPSRFTARRNFYALRYL